MTTGTRRGLARGVAPMGVAAVVVALLAGCAQPARVSPGTADVTDGAGADLPLYGEPCEDAGLPEESPLPPGAVLVRVTRCVFTTETVPGDGVWRVRADQEATTGLVSLATALRLPSKIPPTDIMCAAIAYAPIVIAVTDQTGRRLRPAIPHGFCGEPLQDVIDALATLSWTTTATTRVARIESELAVTSGCPEQYKPMVAITAADGGGGPLAAALDLSGTGLRVCRYELGDDPALTLDVGQGRIVHGGELIAAFTLDSAAGQELVAAVRAAPAAAACDQLESPFAVIGPADGYGAALTVELAGCHRVLVDADNSLRQLDAALVDRLLG